jgi:hypothetical protein
VCGRIGLARRRLGIANATEHADYRAVYDDDLERQVAHFYSQDFELLGYSPKLCA